MRWGEKELGLKIINRGSINKPSISLEIFTKETPSDTYINSLTKEFIYRYNLKLDILDFYNSVKTIPILEEAINNLRGMRPGHPSSLYEYLMIGIALQNASVKRSTQMFSNLLSTYGSKLDFDGEQLLCMWQAGRFDDVDEQELRDLKIGYRAKSIKRVDAQFSEGNIHEHEMRNWDSERQKEKLLSLYGIGPATVWYILFDVFHRWEIFEHISPWEQKIYSKLFFNRGVENPASVDKLLDYIDQFGEYKHLAVHYIWENLWWKRENGQQLEWFENEIRR
jgi:3-methyladenine DNA glycosylase/8-oxoguanine DNA glycosylase